MHARNTILLENGMNLQHFNGINLFHFHILSCLLLFTNRKICTIVVEQLRNQVNVSKEHSSAAVSLQT